MESSVPGGSGDDYLVGYGEEDDLEELQGDVSDMMESHMEEGAGPGGVIGPGGPEDDYEGQMVEVEPEIFLGGAGGEGPFDDSQADFLMDDYSSAAGHFGAGAGFDSFNDSSMGDFTEGSNDGGSFSGSLPGMPGGRPGSSRKTSLGPNCPVCDQVLHRQHARDHVAWHFMDELKEMIVDPGHCPDPGCDYVGDKMENLVRLKTGVS